MHSITTETPVQDIISRGLVGIDASAVVGKNNELLAFLSQVGLFGHVTDVGENVTIVTKTIGQRTQYWPGADLAQADGGVNFKFWIDGQFFVAYVPLVDFTAVANGDLPFTLVAAEFNEEYDHECTPYLNAPGEFFTHFTNSIEMLGLGGPDSLAMASEPARPKVNPERDFRNSAVEFLLGNNNSLVYVKDGDRTYPTFLGMLVDSGELVNAEELTIEIAIAKRDISPGLIGAVAGILLEHAESGEVVASNRYPDFKFRVSAVTTVIDPEQHCYNVVISAVKDSN